MAAEVWYARAFCRGSARWCVRALCGGEIWSGGGGGFYARRAEMGAERCSSYGGSADLANVSSVMRALRAGRILRLGAAARIRGFSA
jgi:hypothetical protein